MIALAGSGARLRDMLVIALTVVTGATDAIAFSRLGGVFTSVMTGNIVLLGVGIGHHQTNTLVHAGLAVLFFIAGSMVGASICGRRQPDDGVWPARLNRALIVEFGLFIAVALVWWFATIAPSGDLATILVGALALALGLQSSAVLRLNVTGLSTTYFTGTLTTLMHSLITTRRLKGSGRSLCSLLALVGGATLGTLLAYYAHPLAPLISLIVLSAVIVIATVSFRDPAADIAPPVLTTDTAS
jgi:uncharacterized membrane protein YoaK (UPF0700 family)